MSKKIAALVLAAGQSTRMGRENKLLLPFGESSGGSAGQTVLGCTVDAVLGSGVAETIVVVGHEEERVRGALAGKPVKIVTNPEYKEGMATSIHAGIRAVAPGTNGVMVCLSDLPLVQAEELREMAAAFAGAPDKSLAVPTYEGQRGNPVFFSLQYREEIFNTRGAVGACKGLVQRYPEQVLEIPMAQDHILRDIDTMRTYREVLATAGLGPPPGETRQQTPAGKGA